MRALLLSLALAAICCGPPSYPTPGGLAVTGARLEPAEQAWLDSAHGHVRDCLRTHGYPAKHRLKHVHVHSTCWFDAPGTSTRVRGYTDLRDGVHVGRDLRAFQHEAAATITGKHSHAPDAATIVCEHAGPRPPTYQCEAK